MPSVYSLRFISNGYLGAPGYSTHRFLNLNTPTRINAAAAAVHQFWNGIAGNWLTTWTGAVETNVLEHDLATGVLLGQHVVTTPPASITGIVTPTAYAGGSGASITWQTNVIFAGHRVTGRTFVVPLVNVFDNDGTLTTASLNMLRASAAQLIGNVDCELAVWARQMSKPTDGSKPVQIGGALAEVTNYLVSDSASQLRSRRR